MPLRSGALRTAALVGFYLILVMALQWAAGAYRSGFGGHSDEGPHYVTGLMVRDYVAHGFPASPMRFAKNYYLHYPQVAFGHWPPVFYILQAAWTLVFPVSRASLLVLMALITAVTAAALHMTAEGALSRVAGFFAGILFVCLPLTQIHTNMLMAEPPLALFGLLAMLALRHFLQEDTLGRAVLFGVLLSAAILTKASGWSLALGTPLAFIGTGNGRRLLSSRLWAAAAVTFILTVPFSWLTLQMTRAGMENRRIDWARISGAVREYAQDLPQCVGIAGLLAVLVGLLAVFVFPGFRGRLDPLWGILGASGMAVLVFHAIVPTLAEPRKIYLLLPVLILFAAAGVHGLGTNLSSGKLKLALPIATMVLIGLQIFSIPRRPVSGLSDAARQLRANMSTVNTVAMVSSSVVAGESAFIAEFVAAEVSRPLHFLLRGSKQLARSGWNGADYHLLYPTAQAVEAGLDSVPVSVVVVYAESNWADSPHQRLLREALKSNSSEWQLAYSAAGNGLTGNAPGVVEIYRRTHGFGDQPIRITVDLTDKLNESIQYGN